MPIAKTVKSNLVNLLGWSRGYKLIKPIYSGIGHILLLHRVCEKENIQRLAQCSGLEVTPEYLEKVIRFFLNHGYGIISLDQLKDRLRKGKSGGKFVVFTLDDGYSDNLTVAYPVFKKYNAPFTIYITTGFADRTTVLWWYLLEDLILKKDFVSFEADGNAYEFRIATSEEKEKAYLKISSIIKMSSEDSYKNIIENIFSLDSQKMCKKTDEMMLDWGQIRELSRDPLVTLGSHTVNHYCLSALSAESVRSEILESKKSLESHINRQVRHFSYPFGNIGEAGAREFKIVKESGFQTATTTRSANIFGGHSSHCEALPRITVGESLDNQRLAFLINGLLHFKNNNFKRVVTE